MKYEDQVMLDIKPECEKDVFQYLLFLITQHNYSISDLKNAGFGKYLIGGR